MILEDELSRTFSLPQGDPRVKALVDRWTKLGVIDWRIVVRLQIKADPCRDWRIIKRHYQVSRAFIYKVWGDRARP